jgi:hypothetical protein
MPTEREQFWESASFAFVGHSAVKPFPRLSFSELVKQGKKVYPVDKSVDDIDGHQTFKDFESLPEKVEAAVLELPKDETAAWVKRAADSGIKKVWIHMGRETEEALAIAKENNMQALTGTCAVMYVKPGPSFHSIHKWINKMIGKY